MIHALLLCVATAAASPPVTPMAPAGPRVFFPRLENGGGVNADEVALLTEALLVEARRYSDRYEVVGHGELERLLDVEASRRALGCEDSACASEVADALDAPELVVGKIGRLGNTWILTLTRIERATATALDRAKIQQQGPAVDVLLPRLGEVIDEVFRHGRPAPDADAGVSPLVTAGVGGLVLGGVGLVAAGGLYLAAAQQLREGLEKQSLAERQQYKAVGEPLYYGSMAALGVGVVGLAAGGVLLGLGAAE